MEIIVQIIVLRKKKNKKINHYTTLCHHASINLDFPLFSFTWKLHSITHTMSACNTRFKNDEKKCGENFKDFRSFRFMCFLYEKKMIFFPSFQPRLADTRRAAIHCADMDLEYYRLRSFSITSHGVCNLGDSMR